MKSQKTQTMSTLLVDIQNKDVIITPIKLSDVLSAWKKYRKVYNSIEHLKYDNVTLNY